MRAIVELVWNAVDAEAMTVSVDLGRSESGAVIKTTVVDDGHGISVDEVPSTFGRIGGSWKLRATKSKNGKRGLHGKLGEGRLRAFALGNRIQWLSHSLDSAGTEHEVRIDGTTTSRNVFSWGAQAAASGGTGTTVTAWNDTQKSLGTLEPERALPLLRAHFAPVLLNDGSLAVTYDGQPLDPSDDISRTDEVPLTFGDPKDPQTATLRIIEWLSGKHAAIYYGADGEHFTHEESARDIESQFSFTAYVTWDGLDHEALSLIGLGDMADHAVGGLWSAVRRGLKEHFGERRRELRREQVVKWREQDVYPYAGEPTTESEKAERAVFDVVSGTLSSQIPARGPNAKLTLALLRDALRSDPDKLTTIIHEVAALNDKDRTTLTKLLSETTLPAIIKAANLVTGRNKFLAGLEHLLFDPVDSNVVGERDHLHKLLERELWIFGESYHLMNSERGLTQMLRTHLKMQGLPTGKVEPLKRWDGKSGRVDLHLAVRMREFDRTRHLVVELKAPDIVIGRKELDQVEDYANVVLSNPAFASERSDWDFLLVGADLNDVARNRIHDSDFERGLFLAPEQTPGQPRVRAYVRRWRNVLDENHRRLQFMTANLEHDPTIEEGMAHIREQYVDLLPDELATA